MKPAAILIVVFLLINIDFLQENVQMIARANLRQLDTVLRMSGGKNEDVAGLREQWKLLSEQAASPIPQLLSKVWTTFSGLC